MTSRPLVQPPIFAFIHKDGRLMVLSGYRNKDRALKEAVKSDPTWEGAEPVELKSEDEMWGFLRGYEKASQLQ